MDLLFLKNALQYGSMHNPDLFPEGKDRNKWEEIRTNAFYRPMLDEVITESNKLMEEPIAALPYSLYKIFEETGSRFEYQIPYFHHRLRLNTFAIMSMVDDHPKYIHALEDAIWAICDEFTWCVPASMSGRSLKVPDSDRGNGFEQKQIIDLFAAETGFALAEILHMTDGRISGIVACRARKEIQKRILEPYMSLGNIQRWETYTHNWAAVCAGSVGSAAMYLLGGNDDALVPLLHRTLGAIECYLSGFGADGASTEGIGYWVYGFGFFTYFAALLERRTAGKINLFENEKVKQIALFQQKCYLHENWTVSFSDAFLKSVFPLGLTHFLKTKYDELAIPDIRYRATFTSDHCHRWAPVIRSFVWSRPEYRTTPPSDAFYFLPDAGWLISRKVTESGAVAFAAKSGHNGEPHNHNDLGSFIFHVNGESILVDPGTGEYTKQYFGPERYSIVCNGSQGHSVPIVDGRFQSAGSEFAARVIDVANSPEADSFTLELAGAYDHPGLQSLIRKFTFVKKDPLKLMLEDEYVFSSASPGSIVERFVSFHVPQIVEPGTVRLQGRNRINVVFNHELVECSIEKTVFRNHSREQVGLYTIDLKVKQPVPYTKVTVTFIIT